MVLVVSQAAVAVVVVVRVGVVSTPPATTPTTQAIVIRIVGGIRALGSTQGGSHVSVVGSVGAHSLIGGVSTGSGAGGTGGCGGVNNALDISIVHPGQGHQMAAVAGVALGGHRGLGDWADGSCRGLHGGLLWCTCSDRQMTTYAYI